MKKHLLSCLISAISILLTLLPIQAQHQRLGISPQSIINLNAKKSSVKIEAFCLDRHKIIDGIYDYNYVLTQDSGVVVTIGRRKLSLQKAIDEKLIKVNSLLSRIEFDSGIGLEFVNLTKLPMTIKIINSLAMGETPGQFSNSAVLNALKTPKPKQDTIWESDIDRVRLESLGYKSVEEYQKEKNLPLNSFDEITTSRLKEDESSLIKRFEAIGLVVNRNDTSVRSASDNIRQFQREAGIKETGIFSPDVRIIFERVEKFVKYDYPIINELREYNTNLESSFVLRVKPSSENENFYSVYSELGKEYEGNKVSEISSLVSLLSQKYGNVILDLDFPSTTKSEAFKSSFDIAQIKSRFSFFEGKPAARNALFSNKKDFEIDSITDLTLDNENYSSTIALKSTEPIDKDKSWKIKAASKLKETVTKFTDAFKSIFHRVKQSPPNEKLSVSSIIEKARRVDSDLSGNKTALEVTISFIDEFGEIHTAKIRPGNPVEKTGE